jgi:hypothetical protein
MRCGVFTPSSAKQSQPDCLERRAGLMRIHRFVNPDDDRVVELGIRSWSLGRRNVAHHEFLTRRVAPLFGVAVVRVWSRIVGARKQLYAERTLNVERDLSRVAVWHWRACPA